MRISEAMTRFVHLDRDAPGLRVMNEFAPKDPDALALQ
jgi:hypothetical protein